MRAFLMNAQLFHLPMAKMLAERGLDIRLVFEVHHAPPTDMASYREALPQADLLEAFEMRGAVVPAWLRARVHPAAVDDVIAAEPYESMGLQMMCRRNARGMSVPEMRTIYLRYVGIWRALLDLHRPQVVIFHGTPHQGHDLVLYALCRKDGIRTLIFERTFFADRVCFREALDDAPKPTAKEIQKYLEAPEEALGGRDANAWYVHNAVVHDLTSIAESLSARGLARQLINPWQLRHALERVHHPIHGLAQDKPLRFVHNLYDVVGRLRTSVAFRAYQAVSEEPIAGEDYVYYPMHYQPERTTLPDGGRYSDQLYVIDVLTASLPPGWMLYVREHPRQFRTGVLWSKTRSRAYYEHLRRNPRVRLITLETSADALVAGSRAVATITGSTGWEAVLRGKPVLFFGEPWYAHCPGATRVRDAGDCTQQLARVARGEWRSKARQARAFGAALRANHAFEGVFTNALLQLTGLSAEENARKYVGPLCERLALRPEMGALARASDGL